jgi:ribosomal protein S14
VSKYPRFVHTACLNFEKDLGKLNIGLGRAVAQAASRWLPTAAARVRVRAACGVCGRQSGTGAGFLRVLRFPLPIIPRISPSS